MDKRGVWLIVAIVGLLAIACCCLVVVTGGLSAFFITNGQTSEVMIEEFPEQIVTDEVIQQPTGEVNESTQPEITPNAEEGTNESQQGGLTPEVLAQMDQIQSDVESYRDLPGVSGLDRKTLTPTELQDRVMNDFFDDYTEDDVFLDLVELNLLGFMNRDFDLFGLYVDLYSEQIAGFYDDETTEMVVIQGEGFGGTERMTYAHEYTHALQDAAYDLDEGLGMNDETCEKDSEYCAAVQALVEGDATLSELIWFQEYATQKDQQDVIDFYNTYESPVFDSAPLFLQEDFVFAYNMGYEFVQTLFDQGGYTAINQAFENPPISTEQILHPELYPEEKPIEVVLPDLSLSLGDEWESIGENSLGEWYWNLIFSKPEKSEWAVDEATAKEAAAGWGGDRYAVYYNTGLDQAVLLSVSEWDSVNDLDQIWNAFKTYGDKRWSGSTSTTADSVMWQNSDQTILVKRNGSRLLWLICPDMGTLDLVKTQVPGF